MKHGIIGLIALALAMLWTPQGMAFELLDDRQLEEITAGSANQDEHRQAILARVPLRYSGRKGSVEGDIVVVPMSSVDHTANLSLMDNAQSNLRSLININAVSSPIQVLLNLNINVHSTIDRVIQVNSMNPD